MIRPQWFGPKVFGFGIGPRSPEGWIVTAVALVAIISVGRIPNVTPHQTLFMRIGIVVALAVIATLTYRGDAS